MLPLPKIDAIEVVHVRVPRSARNRITTSYATLPDASHALVQVHADGLVGLGEAPVELWWTGEDASSACHAIERYLAPPLIGTTVDPRAAAVRMDASLAANPYAKAAVEMALWDLLGRVAGLPLHALLGTGDPQPVPVKYVVGIGPVAHVVDEALRGVALGFGCIKLKVGGELATDLARVRAVRDAVGDGVQIGVDANGGWSHATALGALAPLAATGVVFLEQPVSSRFPHALADVTSRSPVPVVAHESLFTIRDGLAALTGGLAHVWALTPSTHGGLVATLDLLGLARAAGIPCLLGSTVELGVATAFLAQVGAAFDTISGSPVPSDVIGALYHDGDIVTEPVRPVGGYVLPAAGPGLGVTLDEERLSAFAVGRAIETTG